MVLIDLHVLVAAVLSIGSWGCVFDDVLHRYGLGYLSGIHFDVIFWVRLGIALILMLWMLQHPTLVFLWLAGSLQRLRIHVDGRRRCKVIMDLLLVNELWSDSCFLQLFKSSIGNYMGRDLQGLLLPELAVGVVIFVVIHSVCCSNQVFLGVIDLHSDGKLSPRVIPLDIQRID